MSDNLDSRVKALEEEAGRLREMIESLTMGDVKGNFVLELSGPSDVSLFRETRFPKLPDNRACRKRCATGDKPEAFGWQTLDN